MLKTFSSLMRRLNTRATGYAAALTSVAVAIALRVLLNPLLGSQNPYHTLWLAIVFCAWYCGLGPSIAAVALSAIGAWYWVLPPSNSFSGKSRPEIFGMLGYLILSTVIVALGDSTRRVIAKRQEADEGLRKVQEELEDRVKERTSALEKKTAEALEKATLLDLANDAIFVKGANATVSYWNHGAERLYGWKKEEALGLSPHALLQTKFPVPLEEIENGDSWEGELIHTKRDGTQIVVASRWTTLRDESGKPLGWLEINTDISARKRAEKAARSLSARILNLQDAERRRIARGLHDSLGQYLAALKMNLDLMSQSNDPGAELAAECAAIVDQCLAETRTISHLLHPPLLDETGFNSAASWYVDSFSKRSGIKATLNVPSELGRLHKDVEITLFRALQEGLTNVHRHSGSSAVDVQLKLEAEHIQLEIKDNGRGIPADRLTSLLESAAEAGVGIAGMRERVSELGGSLEIRSGSLGTTVVVTVPLIEQPTGDPSDDRDSVGTAA